MPNHQEIVLLKDLDPSEVREINYDQAINQFKVNKPIYVSHEQAEGELILVTSVEMLSSFSEWFVISDLK